MFSLTEADEAFRESDEEQAALDRDQPGDTEYGLCIMKSFILKLKR